MKDEETILAKNFPRAATRPAGQAALQLVMQSLRQSRSVIIDFDGVVITPSFADELLGGLITSLGEIAFSERIILKNVSESARPLVRHIVSQHRKNGG